MTNSWYDSPEIAGNLGGKFMKLKIGDKVSFTVQSIDINKSAPQDFQFKKKNNTFLGFNLLVTSTNGETLTVTSFALLSLLRDNKVVAGDSIKIEHPESGKYKLEVTSRSKAKGKYKDPLETEEAPF